MCFNYTKGPSWQALYLFPKCDNYSKKAIKFCCGAVPVANSFIYVAEKELSRQSKQAKFNTHKICKHQL